MSKKRTRTTVRKVKLLQQGLLVEYELKEIDPIQKEEVITKLTHEGGHPPHPDLLACFGKLAPHLTLICELRGPEVMRGNFTEMEEYKVTALSLSGSGANRGVTLTGQKRLSSDQVLNLNAPFTRFEDSSGTGYLYQVELLQAVEDLLDEAEAYLKGKAELSNQLEIFRRTGKVAPFRPVSAR